MLFFRFNINKFLRYSVIFLSSILLISQIYIFVYSKINEKNVLSAFANSYFKSTEITFTLDKKPNQNIYVLENGEEKAILNIGKNVVNVSDNSVLEIDSTANENSYYIKIDYDKNKLKSSIQRNINAKTNISMVGRIMIK